MRCPGDPGRRLLLGPREASPRRAKGPDEADAGHGQERSGLIRPRLLVIVGPTGTGKTTLAACVAERVGGEIVGCDALQVYRGLDAATAKPPMADRERVRHHVIDFVEPSTDYSLADYVRDARRAIEEIFSRSRVPIVVGGTGMYLRGLLRGIVDAPARDEALRGRLRGMVERHGPERLHRWLRSLDAASAARVSPRDTQRTVRALEMALLSPLTWGERLRAEGTWASGHELWASLKVGLDLPREDLAARLDARVDAFFETGLVAEVRNLLATGLRPDANALKAIGYREVMDALLSGDDPNAVREIVRRRTRQYAKRQRTWFRGETGVTWLDARSDTRALAQTVVTLWRSTTR